MVERPSRGPRGQLQRGHTYSPATASSLSRHFPGDPGPVKELDTPEILTETEGDARLVAIMKVGGEIRMTAHAIARTAAGTSPGGNEKESFERASALFVAEARGVLGP